MIIFYFFKTLSEIFYTLSYLCTRNIIDLEKFGQDLIPERPGSFHFVSYYCGVIYRICLLHTASLFVALFVGGCPPTPPPRPHHHHHLSSTTTTTPPISPSGNRDHATLLLFREVGQGGRRRPASVVILLTQQRAVVAGYRERRAACHLSSTSSPI